MFNSRPLSLAAYTMTPGAHQVAVPFSAYPVGSMISFVVNLYATDSTTSQVVASSAQTSPLAATGGAQQTPSATINLPSQIGEFFQGVALYIGGVLISTTMLAAGQTVVISGVTIGNPIWT